MGTDVRTGATAAWHEPRDWRRDLPVLLTAVILLAAAWNVVTLIPPLAPGGFLGGDFHMYREAAARAIAGGGFYEPSQLAGPYAIVPGDVLYPPTLLYLLVPFLVLPEILWWIIPLGALAVIVARLRPARWTWPLIALALWWPRDIGLIALGNPGMWIAAAIGVGLLYGWPAVLVLLKPSLGFFALIGIRTRAWWLVAGAMALLSLPLIGLWADYATILRNSNGSLLYSILEVPFMLIPVVAWIGRRSLGLVEPLGLQTALLRRVREDPADADVGRSEGL